MTHAKRLKRRTSISLGFLFSGQLHITRSNGTIYSVNFHRDSLKHFVGGRPFPFRDPICIKGFSEVGNAAFKVTAEDNMKSLYTVISEFFCHRQRVASKFNSSYLSNVKLRKCRRNFIAIAVEDLLKRPRIFKMRPPTLSEFNS
jgi:hypothetical protein